MIPAGLVAFVALILIALFVVFVGREWLHMRERVEDLEDHNELLRDMVSSVYSSKTTEEEERAMERFLSLQPRPKPKPRLH